MENKQVVLGWWAFLVIISIFNIAFIIIYMLSHKLTDMQKPLFFFALIFSIVCGIRAIWPTKYVEKTCFLKTKIYTPFIIRILATVAEIAYILIFVFVFLHIIKTIHKFTTHKLDHLKPYIYAVIPLILLAEVFSWLGSVTEYQFWNISEEVMWFISSIILIALSLYILSKIKTSSEPKVKSIYYLLSVTVPIATLFAAFLALVDIPMYIRRFNRNNITEIKDIKSFFRDFENKHKINFNKRLDEMKKCQQVDQSLETWKEEIPWLTGYFTIGVWSSFALAIWHKYHTS